MGEMYSPDHSRTMWRKSSRSGQNGNCVEIANLATSVGVRDSKSPNAGHLTFSRSTWTAFITQAKAGHHDR
jgi:hypothetical protein